MKNTNAIQRLTKKVCLKKKKKENKLLVFIYPI